MNRLREKIESIVFAGLKPGGAKASPQVAAPASFMGRLRQRIDRWISGSGNSDPLYLTNRTTAQKVRAWIVIGIPLLILVAAVGLSLSTFLDPPKAAPVKDLTPAEVAAKLLPNLKDLKLEAGSDIEVVELRIDHNKGLHIAGSVRNKSTHPLASADISCNLTDATGTQLGGVNIHVDSIPASGVKNFEVPIQQTDTAFVLVREIQAR
jgi:hypothetical protein